jgi:hypothetical protein
MTILMKIVIPKKEKMKIEKKKVVPKYEEMEQLPINAVKVRTFAESKGITVGYVYKLYKQRKIKIVSYDGINFVLP